MGIDLSLLTEQIQTWVLTHGLRILLILIGAYAFHRFHSVFIDKLIERTITGDKLLSREAEKKRADTLVRVFKTAVHIVVLSIILLMILSELGVDIGPLIAGAGIIGIAAGFGGQYLVKDIITGFLSYLRISIGLAT